ncbi:hypothetical protein LINPERPRIM_LOCUS36404 [Linum perenne]
MMMLRRDTIDQNESQSSQKFQSMKMHQSLFREGFLLEMETHSNSHNWSGLKRSIMCW